MSGLHLWQQTLDSEGRHLWRETLSTALSGSGLGDCFLSGGPLNALPAASIGGIKSSVHVSQRLFGRVTQAQHDAQLVRYRCIYLTASALDLRMYVKTQPANATIAIGWGAAKNVTEVAVANENTAPAGVVFTSPANAAAAISGGAISWGDWRGFWIQQTLLDVDPTTSDPFVIEAVGA